MKVRLPEYTMTDSQKRAMDEEIKRQLFDIRDKTSKDIDTMILWTLHKRFRFGKKRLEEFFHTFICEYNDFKERYEMNDAYPERLKLKEECVLDIEELYKNENCYS